MISYLKTTLLLLFLPVYAAFAQVTFVDAVSKQPVPSASIYHSDGNLIGFSNKDGILELIPEVKDKNLDLSKISVQHISYENASFSIANLKQKQTLDLIPITNVINEITVSSAIPDYYRLRGYFRTLETYDLKHKSFSDGIVEYYIPTKKGQIKYRLLDYRVYRDSAVVDDYDEKMGPFFQAPRVAKLFAGTLADRLTAYDFVQEATDEVSLVKKGEKVGNLNLSDANDRASLYIDYVAPDSAKLQKIFRIEANIRMAVSIENFTLRPIASLTAADLTNVYQAVGGSIKRKAEHGYVPYEVINEFYTMERAAISKAEYKKLERSLRRSLYKVEPKSVYKEDFWNQLAPYHIPPINESLAKQLDTNLKLVK